MTPNPGRVATAARGLRPAAALLPFVLLLAAPAAPLAAADWPQFRGPGRDGVSPESGLDLLWREGGAPDVLWRAPVGEGYSGISVVGDRLFTLHATGGDERLTARGTADGRELWSLRLDAEYRDGQGDGPRSTPTVHDGVVYALGAKGVLVAARAADGEEVWRVDLKEVVGARPPRWGVATSPLVEGDLLLLDAGGPEGASMVALERATGEVAWTAGDDIAGYAAPVAVTVGGVRQAIFFTGTRVVSVAPESGSLLWQRPWRTSYDVNAAAPVAVGADRLFIASGYDVGGALFELGSRGGAPTVREVWRTRGMKNQFSTSVYRDGVLYGFDNATLKAIDAATGEDLWRTRGLGHGSLIWADGRLIVLGERGELVVAEATPEAFRPLARHQALEGKCWTAPSLADGRLYLRNEEEMVAIDVRNES